MPQVDETPAHKRAKGAALLKGRRGADDGKEQVEELRGDCDAGSGCRKIKSVGKKPAGVRLHSLLHPYALPMRTNLARRVMSITPALNLTG